MSEAIANHAGTASVFHRISRQGVAWHPSCCMENVEDGCKGL